MSQTLRSHARDLIAMLPGAAKVAESLIHRQHPVFMFHRILPAGAPCYEAEMTATPEILDSFLTWVTSRYTVAPLGELARVPAKTLSHGKPLCSITFDDGWRDNYDYAFPVLHKHKIPATIFVATGFIGTSRRLWQDRLWRVLVAGTRPWERAEIAEKLWMRFPWCPRLTATDIHVRGIRQVLMQCGSADADAFLDYLEELTGERFPETERGFLTWQEVDQMQRAGIDFGCHTHNHTLLTSVSPAVALSEVHRSKQELEERLNRTVESFSYPWGRTVNHTTRQVMEAGFRCAVTADVGTAHGHTDPYLISRIPVSGPVLARDSDSFEPRKALVSFALTQFRAAEYRTHDVQQAGSAEPLRIALLIDTIDNWSGGGTEGHIRHLLNALDRRYFQPELFLLDPTPVAQELIPCPVHVVAQGDLPRPLRAVRDLTAKLKAFQPHIVQTFFPDATLFGTIAARRVGVPVIIHAERNAGYGISRRDRMVRTWLRRRVTGFQCNSRTIETLLRAEIAQNRIEILQNHLNTDAFQPLDEAAKVAARKALGLDPQSPLFVCVANLRRVKDLESCIAAMALVRVDLPDAKLVLIGEGELRQELEAQIDRLQLRQAVCLAGLQEDVRPWLTAADVGILSSKSEGSSNAVLEYMAAGLPTLLSSIPANRELVDGVFFKTGDAEDLAAQLVRLYGDGAKRAILAKENRMRALQYGTEAFRERAQAYYVRLASRFEGEIY